MPEMSDLCYLRKPRLPGPFSSCNTQCSKLIVTARKTKLREGNIFTRGCQSVQGNGEGG